jgi:hypothetical protein
MQTNSDHQTAFKNRHSLGKKWTVSLTQYEKYNVSLPATTKSVTQALTARLNIFL